VTHLKYSDDALRAVTLTEFRAAPKAGALIRTAAGAAVEPTADPRRFRFVVSTGAASRNHFEFRAEGWRLKNFMRNPVIQWAHKDDLLPIGRALNVWREGSRLKADVELTPAGWLRFNDTVARFLAGGFLRAVSVGWFALRWHWRERPKQPPVLVFDEQDLLEISVVSVPADAGALLVGPVNDSTAGRSSAAARRRVLELLDLQLAEAKRRTAAGHRGTSEWRRRELELRGLL